MESIETDGNQNRLNTIIVMKKYRMGATLTPLLIRNLIAELAIIVLVNEAQNQRPETRPELDVPVGMVLLAGPGYFFFYLIRFSRISVAWGIQDLSFRIGGRSPGLR